MVKVGALVGLVLALLAVVLSVVSMATLEWFAGENSTTIGGSTTTVYTYAGLREWKSKTEIVGSDGSVSASTESEGNYEDGFGLLALIYPQPKEAYFEAGTHVLGSGIPALIVGCATCVGMVLVLLGACEAYSKPGTVGVSFLAAFLVFLGLALVSEILGAGFSLIFFIGAAFFWGMGAVTMLPGNKKGLGPGLVLVGLLLAIVAFATGSWTNQTFKRTDSLYVIQAGVTTYKISYQTFDGAGDVTTTTTMEGGLAEGADTKTSFTAGGATASSTEKTGESNNPFTNGFVRDARKAGQEAMAAGIPALMVAAAAVVCGGLKAGAKGPSFLGMIGVGLAALACFLGGLAVFLYGGYLDIGFSYVLYCGVGFLYLLSGFAVLSAGGDGGEGGKKWSKKSGNPPGGTSDTKGAHV